MLVQVSKLFRELDMAEGQGHLGNRHSRAWKEVNKTALLLQCRLDPAPLECRSHWVTSSEIPTVVADEYLAFSFVRDPFARVLSAHREVLQTNEPKLIASALSTRPIPVKKKRCL